MRGPYTSERRRSGGIHMSNFLFLPVSHPIFSRRAFFSFWFDIYWPKMDCSIFKARSKFDMLIVRRREGCDTIDFWWNTGLKEESASRRVPYTDNFVSYTRDYPVSIGGKVHWINSDSMVCRWNIRSLAKFNVLNSYHLSFISRDSI